MKKISISRDSIIHMNTIFVYYWDMGKIMSARKARSRGKKQKAGSIVSSDESNRKLWAYADSVKLYEGILSKSSSSEKTKRAIDKLFKR